MATYPGFKKPGQGQQMRKMVADMPQGQAQQPQARPYGAKPLPRPQQPQAQGRGVVTQGGVQGVEGRGGNFQPLGKAAMSRLPGGGGDLGDRGVFQQKPLDAGAGSGGAGAEGAGIEAAIGGLKQQLGMPPTSSGRPAQLQGDQLAQALERRGMPFGQGTQSQGMPTDAMTAADMATRPLPGLANGGGAGGGISGRPMPMDLETPGMGGQQSPDSPLGAGALGASPIFQRLNAMRGGGPGGFGGGIAAGNAGPYGGFMGGQQPQVPGPGQGQGNPYANLLKQRLASVGAGGGMPGPVGTF